MYGRLRYLGWAFAFFLLSATLTRLVLAGYSFDSLDRSFLSLLKTFGIGLFHDAVTALYYFLPLAFYLAFIPQKWYNTKIHRFILTVMSVFIVFITLFNAVSEYIFWDEFGKRFNFIAVDYLVYTHEVIHNIEESYPVTLILSILFLVAVVIVYLSRRWIVQDDYSRFGERLVALTVWLLGVGAAFTLMDKQPLSHVTNNTYNNELAKNGTYALFSAFRHNELDYDEFYKTIPLNRVFSNLRRLEGFDDKTRKKVTFSKPPLHKNIVLIMVESLSAEYMGIFGNKLGLTPNLDRLAKHSLFFDHFFATGTRTVRGMEAVTLSVPPTPGRSIVKRPVNDTLDSFGKVMAKNGYDNAFIYAGHGYFDNMNDFFSKNGFRIVDRTDFEDDEITFANVWGVCDEDLFAKTLREADASFRQKKPFFYFVMTTSNHRPYTYPSGRIDIPSHTGRNGAVKYTDYAIGKFLNDAAKKPWFKDTLFVIVADHNGGSAGKTALPLYRYKIPLIIYAPYLIAPQTIHKLASQIDTMPTVLSLLRIGYEGRFYGNDILSDRFKQRAFIGNYQKLGFVQNGVLTFLTPDKKVHKRKIVSLGLRNVRYENDDANITQEELETVVTYYQSASYFYKQSLKKAR